MTKTKTTARNDESLQGGGSRDGSQPEGGKDGGSQQEGSNDERFQKATGGKGFGGRHDGLETERGVSARAAGMMSWRKQQQQVVPTERTTR